MESVITSINQNDQYLNLCIISMFVCGLISVLFSYFAWKVSNVVGIVVFSTIAMIGFGGIIASGVIGYEYNKAIVMARRDLPKIALAETSVTNYYPNFTSIESLKMENDGIEINVRQNSMREDKKVVLIDNASLPWVVKIHVQQDKELEGGDGILENSKEIVKRSDV